MDLLKEAVGRKRFGLLLNGLFAREGSRVQTIARAWQYWREHTPIIITPESLGQRTQAAIAAHPNLAKAWKK